MNEAHWKQLAHDRLVAANQYRERMIIAENEVARCHVRLEIDKASKGNGEEVVIPMQRRHLFADGIECRDDTIRILEGHIKKLTGRMP